MSSNWPFCVFHGKRRDEHFCLVCDSCYRDLWVEECYQEPDGTRITLCWDCAIVEAHEINRRRQ